jgi:hypothetical protein
MNAAVIKAASKVLESTDTIEVGNHHVDFIVSITDNIADETTTHHYQGTVSKSSDQMIAATATIPWLQVVGRMAIALGATQDNTLKLLRECILGAVNGGQDVSSALLELDVRIAGTVDKVKKELTGSLPKIPRAGAVKVLVQESVEVETMSNCEVK